MNVNSLINTLSIQTTSYDQASMQRYIFRQIAKMGLTPVKDDVGNIYVIKGQAEVYPTMVSHMDTVHPVNHDVVVKRHNNFLYAFDTKLMEQYGIGGDDKVGVFITLECLKHFDNFKAAFFVDEEVGCIGSSKANIEFFRNSSIILQCDRKGTHDFTDKICSRQMLSTEFKDDTNDILASYRRNLVNGGMTDVYELSQKLDIVMANMSCGYYNPHSDTEYVDMNVIEDTLNLCIDLFERTKNKQYQITRPTQQISSYQYAYNQMWGIHDYPVPQSYYNSSYRKLEEADRTNLSPHIPKSSQEITVLDQKCPMCQQELYYDDYEDCGYCFTCDTYEIIEPTTKPLKEYNYES